jgi:CBS domain containing-hemolysin-like protein
MDSAQFALSDLPLLEIIGIAVCLVFSGFFSGSETALTSLSMVRLEGLLEKHPVYARALSWWKNNPNGILTTILLGNNLANITASVLATDLASRYFSTQGIPIAIGGMTFLLLFTGEITPKTFARTYSDQLAPLLMNLVVPFHILFYPVTWILTQFIKGMFWMLGSRYRRGERVTEEDIEYIVSLGRRQGILDEDKENLISSIFEFSDTTTKEIMVPRTDMVSVSVNSPYEKVVELSLETGFSRIPVFEESIDKIVGIFYTKNLITPPGAEEHDAFLTNRMRPAVFVPESKKISEVLRKFQRDRIHLAIVVDEFGGTGGMVTMEDIIEELLGEIQDEFDTEEERLVNNGDGSFLADARINIGDLEEGLSIEFPEERDYESLGGYLMEEAHEVPVEGWEHRFQGYAFQVTEADPQRVIRVRIRRVQKEEPPDSQEDTDGPESEEPINGGPVEHSGN